MFQRTHLAFIALGVLALPLRAEDPVQKISGPFSQSNLSVFLLHGKDTLPSANKILTLQEAIDQKKVIVHETSNVDQLAVENTSDDVEVFAQSGDIVKGGRQDRLIACDMIIPPKSGKIPIGSFCCESGRWQKRGAESSAQFGASSRQAANKDVKLAVNASRDQGQVWSKVQEAQQKLAKNVSKTVANAQSPSSYQLTLEDKEVLAKVEAYTKSLEKLAADNADAIGFVIVINGKVEGAELYGSHSLFLKLWPKLIFGAAVDALSEFDAKKKFEVAHEADVKKFLTDAGKGKEKEVLATVAGGQQPLLQNAAPNQPAGQAPQQLVPSTPSAPESAPPARIRVTSIENDKTVMLEAKDRKDNTIVHRSYIAK